MNDSAQPLHIWIFNDASIASLLRADSPLWPDFIPGLLAELSTATVLAHSLNLEIPSPYLGLAGLLNSSTSPADLAVPLPDISFPAILSPSHALAPASAIAALRRLRSDPRILGPRVLILEAALAGELLPSLAFADRIGIAWDISSPPGTQLQMLLSALEGENLLRPSHWAGLIGYFSPDHQATDDERAAAAAMLAPLSFARMLHN
jgi:hypothetical protein